MNRDLRNALRTLVALRTHQPLDERLEAAIDLPTKRVLMALARDLAGEGGNPNIQRSAAARLLLRRGAEAMLADETLKA